MREVARGRGQLAVAPFITQRLCLCTTAPGCRMRGVWYPKKMRESEALHLDRAYCMAYASYGERGLHLDETTCTS